MPQVTISSSKGLEQTSGSGFSVSDVELVRSNESITPTGAVYIITPSQAHDGLGDGGGTDYGTDWFELEGANGDVFRFWFSTTAAQPAPGVVGGTEIEVDLDDGADKSVAQVCTAIQSAIDGSGSSNVVFEAVATATEVTVYVLETGAMTNSTPYDITTANSAAAIGVSVTDGSSGDLDEDVEASLITIGNDIASVVLQSVDLANGSSVGQRKNIMFAPSSTSATMVVGGSFMNGGSAATLLTSTATEHGAVCLVWSGSAWVVVHNVNVTAS